MHGLHLEAPCAKFWRPAMAASSLLTLIDDVASILDDVATMTKVATKKTAGVLGDDLALNAESVTGVNPDRELPVVWSVFKGALINKAILVPVALLISAFVPVLITPLLMLGGLFLCFEGTEKVLEKFFHGKDEAKPQIQPTADGHAPSSQKKAAAANVDPAEYEKQKIRGAVRTDFILSAEIIVIALGTMTEATIAKQIIALVVIALVVNVGVYGLVAGIVKLDDAGLALSRSEQELRKKLGRLIIAAAPKLMIGLGIVGTLAMFLVGGGIVVHGIPPLHHWVEHVAAGSAAFGWLLPTLTNFVVGLACGLVLVGLLTVVNKIRGVKH